VRAVHARNGLIAALDVGSSKIACIIGRAEHGGIQVLGSALHESQGIRSGAVTNLDLAEQSIRKAVDAAEQLADHRIQDVILAVQCGQPKSLNTRAEAAPAGTLINDAPHAPCLRTPSRCRKRASRPSGGPTGYVVDRAGVSTRGMFCERLGVSVHARCAGPLQDLKLAVERCHSRLAASFTRRSQAPCASAG
jgi:cell division protein FtsA